jgi:hypothetical protein
VNGVYIAFTPLRWKNSRLNEFLAKRNVTPIEQIGFAKKKRQ